MNIRDCLRQVQYNFVAFIALLEIQHQTTLCDAMDY